jgi:hypothetical protein
VSDDSEKTTPIVTIATIAVLVVGVLAFVLWPRGAQVSPDADFDAFEGGDAAQTQTPPTSVDAGTSAEATEAGSTDRGSVVVLEDRVERSGNDDERRESASNDAGGSQRSADGGYSDPVNNQVLGPESWMAELPEEEREDIDQQLDEPPPKQFPLDLGVRREGIEVAKAVVFDCYDALQTRQPGRTGRIVVSFDVVATGSEAALRNVDVPTNLDLEDPQFESCIIDGIEGLRVPASEDGEMHVEYPFLFDLEGKR